MSTALEIGNLATGYRNRQGNVTVGHDLCGSLDRGSFTCLLGVNGAGKSTLLRTLSGFLRPLGGDIRICGKSLRDMSSSSLPRMLSVVLTHRITVANMTVTDLVALGRAPYTGFWGSLSQADRDATRRAIELVDASELAGRKVATLSDGERQKVMIAKALAQDTPLIFLDEATAFLDYPGKIEIMQLLRRLAHSEGKTVFMSTHDLPLALQTADNLWLLDRSRGLTTGPPPALIATGEIGRYFDRGDITFKPETISFHIPE